MVESLCLSAGDKPLLQQGVRLSQYQNLLIRKAIDTSSISLANGFSHSLVRRRIAMMHKTSNPWMQMKVLYILPLIIIALSAFATPAMKKPVERLCHTSDEEASRGKLFLPRISLHQYGSYPITPSKQ